jgi:hypothetical protein
VAERGSTAALLLGTSKRGRPTAARAYNPHVNPHVDLVRHAYVDDSNVAGIVLKV